MVSWRHAWDEYVRGNVASDAAAKLIQRFLLKAMASSGKADDGGQSDADASEDETELPPLKLSSPKFQELFQTAAKDESLGDKLRSAAKAKAKKSSRLYEYDQSHRIGERLWKSKPAGLPAADRTRPGHMFEGSYQDHLAALAERIKEDDAHVVPFDEKRDSAAAFNLRRFPSDTVDNVEAGQSGRRWLRCG